MSTDITSLEAELADIEREFQNACEQFRRRTDSAMAAFRSVRRLHTVPPASGAVDVP